jgi:hypothetical protein
MSTNDLDAAWHDIQTAIPTNTRAYHTAMQQARAQLPRPTTPTRPRSADIIDLTTERRRRRPTH